MSKKTKKIALSEKELLFYADIMLGQNVTQAAKNAKISRETGYVWMKKFDGFLGDNVSIDQYRLQSSRLLPLALKSLTHHLSQMDKFVTIQYLKGHGVFKDIQDVNITDKEADKEVMERRIKALKSLGVKVTEIAGQEKAGGGKEAEDA